MCNKHSRRNPWPDPWARVRSRLERSWPRTRPATRVPSSRGWRTLNAPPRRRSTTSFRNRRKFDCDEDNEDDDDDDVGWRRCRLVAWQANTRIELTTDGGENGVETG